MVLFQLQNNSTGMLYEVHIFKGGKECSNEGTFAKEALNTISGIVCREKVIVFMELNGIFSVKVC